MIAVLVDEPDRVKDLHRLMGVEARQDLRDVAQIPVDERTQTSVVFNRAAPRAPCDEELEVGDAERVLNVDGEKTETEGVVRGRAQLVLVCPRRRGLGAILVWNTPDLPDAARIEVCRNPELMHVCSKSRNREATSVAPSLT